MVVLWSKSRDRVGYLQHVDRIDSGNSVQGHRPAAARFLRFGRPGRDLDCRRQELFADAVDDRGVRVPRPAWLYLYRPSEARRDPGPCHLAMVVAGKPEAPVGANRVPANGRLFPSLFVQGEFFLSDANRCPARGSRPEAL